MEKLDYISRKSLALYVLMNVFENETLVPTANEADSILTMVMPLIRDEDAMENNGETQTTPSIRSQDVDPEDFAEEQGIVARFVNVTMLFEIIKEKSSLTFQIRSLPES